MTFQPMMYQAHDLSRRVAGPTYVYAVFMFYENNLILFNLHVFAVSCVAQLTHLKVKLNHPWGFCCTANSIINIKLTLMVGSTRSMAAHWRGVRLLASSRITCSWRKRQNSLKTNHQRKLYSESKSLKRDAWWRCMKDWFTRQSLSNCCVWCCFTSILFSLGFCQH